MASPGRREAQDQGGVAASQELRRGHLEVSADERKMFDDVLEIVRDCRSFAQGREDGEGRGMQIFVKPGGGGCRV